VRFTYVISPERGATKGAEETCRWSDRPL